MLVLKRWENESWKDCAIRYAKHYGLEEEVLADYEKYINNAAPEEDAAFWACENWDILDYEPEVSNETGSCP